MARRKYVPPLSSICKVGTVAHNRPFTAKELAQYTGASSRLVRWLKSHGHVRSVEGRKLYPTAKGWNMIEKACKLPTFGSKHDKRKR